MHDEDDPEGLAGWLYHLDVIRSYRGRSISKAAAYNVNTTARLVLKTGKEFIVFASADAEGVLETGNYCDPYTGKEFSLELEKQVMACIASEKAAESPNKKVQPTPGAAELRPLGSTADMTSKSNQSMEALIDDQKRNLA